jgi:hypothetical protein
MENLIMKAIATLLTSSLFVAGAYADSGTVDIYGGFAKGNTALSQWQPSSSEQMAGAPTASYVGSGTRDIYGGFAKPNSVLSQWKPAGDEQMTGVQPAIGDAPYGLGGSQDSALFKSGPSANRVDIYDGFASPDGLPSSF